MLLCTPVTITGRRLLVILFAHVEDHTAQLSHLTSLSLSLSLTQMQACRCVHTHTYKDTHIHTHLDTHTYTDTHTETHTQTHTDTHTHTTFTIPAASIQVPYLQMFIILTILL